MELPHRHQRRTRRAAPPTAPTVAPRHAPDDAPAPEPVDPLSHRRVDAVADRLALDAALAELPDEFRVAVVLRDVGDLDYAEIATALDVPVGTVKSRIARGRAMLMTKLGNRDDPPERPTPAHSDPERDRP